MTTNFAEVYNWMIRGVCGLPLIAIVEFIVHGYTDYFGSLKIKHIWKILTDILGE
jgi:hypothetical protein